MIGAHKEIKELVRKAEREGWHVAQVRNGHIKWTAPSGRVIYTAFSPRSTHGALYVVNKAMQEEREART
jgi:hypothetical protein